MTVAIVDHRDRIDRWTSGFIQIGNAAYPTTGLIRLVNNGGGIVFHNSGALSVVGLELDGTDTLIVGSASAACPTTTVRAGTQIILNVLGTTALLASTTSLVTAVPVIAFRSDVASPIIRQSDLNTASGTGQAMLVHAQNAIGATSTGGNLLLRAGTGTTVNGSLHLQDNTTDRIVIDATGIGFFTATPVARQSVTGSRANPEQALASLLTALGATKLGLITDSSTP